MIHHIYSLLVPALAPFHLIPLQCCDWYNNNTTYIIKKSGNKTWVHVKTNLAIQLKSTL